MLSFFLLCWCTSCSGKRQSRAETSAPPESTITSVVKQDLRLLDYERREAFLGEQILRHTLQVGSRKAEIRIRSDMPVRWH